MVNRITVRAWETAGDPDAFPEGGEPWQPLKLYYHHTFHRQRIEAMHQAMLDKGLESPYAERLEKWKADPDHDRKVTTRVPCAEYFPIRDRALIAHATQIDPDGHWFAIPLEVHQKAWPTEDYELVHSLVPTDLPEDDLFAGARDLASSYDGRRESIAV
jgi:mycothiol S-conjugate amidase